MRSVGLSFLLLLATAAAALAQPDPPKKPPPQPIPPDLVLHDLRSAYSRTTADEVAVRFRPPLGSGATERTDTFNIRIDPGEAPNQPRAVLLELGALRIHLASGRLTAINTAVPDKVYTRGYEALTPATLAKLLPPLPTPQLALLVKSDPSFKHPLQALSDVSWESAAPDESAHPPLVSMKGSSPAGTAELVMNVQSQRLTRLTATIRRAGSEGTLELTFRPLDPGDPAKWAINTEGRQPVPSLMDLKPSTRPLPPVEPGHPVPNLTLSRFDMSAWSLYEAIDAGQPRVPVALILFRYPAATDHAEAAMRDARAGLVALRQVHQAGGRFTSAASAVADLGEFNRDRWEQARKAWSGGGTPKPNPVLAADDLLWSPSAGQSIDRLAPAAAAIVAIIRPDHTLATVIPLDGRSDRTIELVGELAEALKRADQRP